MKASSPKLLIQNGLLYLEDRMIENGYLKIKNQYIDEIGRSSELADREGYEIITVPKDYKIIPGMIDLHIHGLNGADTMDATTDALDVISSTLPMEGTTSFLPTTMTEDPRAIERSLINTGTYINANHSHGKAAPLGIHLEGPFINKDRIGAQPVDHVQPINLNTFKKWESLSSHTIKLVTLAPELPGGIEFINYLKNQRIISSVAHSQATYDQVLCAIEAGLNHVTHLFNQMTGLHHREPGIVGAAFLQGELMVELIADGIHVRPEMVKLAYQQITEKRLILITDSMRAKWLHDGQYELGGQIVTVKAGKALIRDHVLAGSVLKMIDAFKNIQLFTGCSIQAAIKMASENPAKQLGLFDRKGSLAVGKDADIVILDDKMNVYLTICNGEIAYRRDTR